MTQFKSGEVERKAVQIVTAMMAASARSAPKTRGVDAIETMVLDGDDLESLASAMERMAEEQPSYFSSSFNRDADNVRNSSCVLLIGVTGKPKKIEEPLNCGACGYKRCEDLLKVKKRQGKDFRGPICIFQAIDLGIALSSAVKLASQLNVDNRMMYTAGAAAKKMGFLDCDVVIGIPTSVMGKNIYFDRQ